MYAALPTKTIEMKIRSELYEMENRMETREKESKPNVYNTGRFTEETEIENCTGIIETGNYPEKPETDLNAKTQETANAPEIPEVSIQTENSEAENSEAKNSEAKNIKETPKVKNIIFIGRTESGESADESKESTVSATSEEKINTGELLSDMPERLKRNKAGKTSAVPVEKPVLRKTGPAQPRPRKMPAAGYTGKLRSGFTVNQEIYGTGIPAAATGQKAQKTQKTSMIKDLLYLLLKIATIALVFTLLLTFLFGVVRYQEPSMAPMIKDGDLVIFYRYTQSGYLPRDVIALDYEGNRMARRVVATAGDTVDITVSGLVINGALQQETEIYNKTEQYQDGISFPIVVPEGHVFVLSDHRTGATDSRIFGSVKIENTLGKVMAVIRRRNI